MTFFAYKNDTFFFFQNNDATTLKTSPWLCFPPCPRQTLKNELCDCCETNLKVNYLFTITLGSFRILIANYSSDLSNLSKSKWFHKHFWSIAQT